MLFAARFIGIAAVVGSLVGGVRAIGIRDRGSGFRLGLRHEREMRFAISHIADGILNRTGQSGS